MTLRLRLVHKVVDTFLIDTHIVVTDPVVVQVIELVVILHRVLLVARVPDIAPTIGSRLLVFSLSLTLLLRLALTFLAIIGLLLVSAVLLDWSKRVVKLEPRQHRLYQVLEVVSATDITCLREIFRATNVFFVCRGWLSTGGTRAVVAPLLRRFLSILFSSCGSLFPLLVLVRLQSKNGTVSLCL